jgi:hypothetical protein
MQSRGLRADDAAGGVATAFEVDELGALDGKVALDLARNACRLWGVSLGGCFYARMDLRQGSYTDPGMAGE